MELIVKHEENVSIISIIGEVVAENTPELKKRLADLLTADQVRIVVDMTNMDYIDSSGLAVLITKSNDFRKKKGDIRLSAMNDTVRHVFDVTFLSQHFRIYPLVEEALKDF